MIYSVLIAVDHNGKKIKPGGTIDLTAEQAAPLIRSGFIRSKGQHAAAQADFTAVAETAVNLHGTLQALAAKNEAAATAGKEEQETGTTQPATELDRVIAAIGKIDPAQKELFTGSGKPKTEAFEGIEGIDFTVSAALRDQAWDQYQKQKAE